jgi:hypothetical protein
MVSVARLRSSQRRIRRTMHGFNRRQGVSLIEAIHLSRLRITTGRCNARHTAGRVISDAGSRANQCVRIFAE